RGRLLVRPTEHGLALRVGTEPWPELPAGTLREGTALVHEWQELERRGFKVRSRALTNTLFARLLLADLFIHGIGGGKYDELTDAILRRFYAVEPTGYLVLSATLLLPLPPFAEKPEECRGLAREVRDLHYNPQRHLEDRLRTEPRVRELAAEKQAWIERQPAGEEER